MARRSRSSASPARSPSMTQTRSASTTTARPMAPAAARPMTPAAAPAAGPPAMASAPQQPGLFAQMATTAAGVAVGSTVGHMLGNGISSMFGSSEPAPQEHAQPQYQSSSEHGSTACGADALAYAKCLETNNYDPMACQVFKELLDQCKSFAHQRF